MGDCMIIEFNQTARQPNPTFVGTINGNNFLCAKGSTSGEEGYILYGNQKITISDIHREEINGKKSNQVTDFILNGYRLGYIYPDVVPQKKIWIFSIGYDYFEFCFNNQNYKVFEVGLGDDQHYFCVYQGDVTIAIIHQKDLKIDFKDMYTIYALDNIDAVAMCALTLYFDSILEPDYNEYSGHSQIDEAHITTQKELIAKYDSTFIPRIIEAEKKKQLNNLV